MHSCLTSAKDCLDRRYHGDHLTCFAAYVVQSCLIYAPAQVQAQSKVLSHEQMALERWEATEMEGVHLLPDTEINMLD